MSQRPPTANSRSALLGAASINGGIASVSSSSSSHQAANAPTSRTRLLEPDNYREREYNSVSDSEATYDRGHGHGHGYGTVVNSGSGGLGPPGSSKRVQNSTTYGRAYSDFEATDDEDGRRDEFGESGVHGRERSLRTGRQRKKLAARTKGGEFQQRRKKRRVYFCCISSDVDVQKLFDYLTTSTAWPAGSAALPAGWKFQLYPGGDVLHLYKPGVEAYMESSPHGLVPIPPFLGQAGGALGDMSPARGTTLSDPVDPFLTSPPSQGKDTDREREESEGKDFRRGVERRTSIGSQDGAYDADYRLPETDAKATQFFDNKFRISAAGAQEVFVFDFGAVVFWGFSRGEEAAFLKTIRLFVTKGLVGPDEFEPGEDDMAFTTSPELTRHDGDKFTLTNDFITLPDDSSVKERLSISFAIGQSSVLAIFEDRIERKVEEYKYIPEALAALGKVHLTEQQLGIMIGEVFVIRHDVNLHTEILDTPSFFWKEEAMEQDYKMVMDYLEMTGRTEILNKRLDMLRELLDVLQQQMESHHAMNLEWIVIWLIVVEVVLQLVSIGTDSIGTYLQGRYERHASSSAPSL